ncbi:MAG: response regulator [Nibricoccus sp.]
MSAVTKPNDFSSHPYTVLIADDDDIGRHALFRLLERQGYRTIEARTGAEVREVLRTEAVDLLITDIKMEGNSRLELLEFLSTAPLRVSVILMTGFPTVETAAAATSFAAAAYLIKPIDLEQLLNLVRKQYVQRMTLRGLQQSRRRQEDVLERMRRLESLLEAPECRASNEMLFTYVSLAFDSAAESLQDMKTLLNAALSEGGLDVAEQFRQSRPAALVGAIHEAIQVIDRTRHSFKSKELAALRQKLESVLSG